MPLGIEIDGFDCLVSLTILSSEMEYTDYLSGIAFSASYFALMQFISGVGNCRQ